MKKILAASILLSMAQICLGQIKASQYTTNSTLTVDAHVLSLPAVMTNASGVVPKPYTWTSDQTFNGGVFGGHQISISGTTLNDVPINASLRPGSVKNIFELWNTNRTQLYFNVNSNGVLFGDGSGLTNLPSSGSGGAGAIPTSTPGFPFVAEAGDTNIQITTIWLTPKVVPTALVTNIDYTQYMTNYTGSNSLNPKIYQIHRFYTEISSNALLILRGVQNTEAQAIIKNTNTYTVQVLFPRIATMLPPSNVTPSSYNGGLSLVWSVPLSAGSSMSINVQTNQTSAALLIGHTEAQTAFNGTFTGDGSGLTNVPFTAGGSSLSVLGLYAGFLVVTNLYLDGAVYNIITNSGTSMSGVAMFQYQETNQSFTITGFTGLLSGFLNAPGKEVLNTAATNITVSALWAFPGSPGSTNLLVIPPSYYAEMGFEIKPGIRTNIFTTIHP